LGVHHLLSIASSAMGAPHNPTGGEGDAVPKEGGGGGPSKAWVLEANSLCAAAIFEVGVGGPQNPLLALCRAGPAFETCHCSIGREEEAQGLGSRVLRRLL
jgi:hypothetical protein